MWEPPNVGLPPGQGMTHAAWSLEHNKPFEIPPDVNTPEDVDKLPLPDLLKMSMKQYIVITGGVSSPFL